MGLQGKGRRVSLFPCPYPWSIPLRDPMQRREYRRSPIRQRTVWALVIVMLAELRQFFPRVFER